mmetsp:Transcript_122966/g.348531  ORF Transcript_122966/g.348531 Transcript_122966/m.348531 type:complete len:325 (-) Transcript_122966:193-1167(-)
MDINDSIELQTADVIDFSRAVSRFTERNLELSFVKQAPVQVTYVMGNATFEHTFPCTPVYGELWKTVCDHLQADAAAALALKLYMDDELLTNRNTQEVLSEAVQSASAIPAVILTVRRQPDEDRGAREAPARPAPSKAGPCSVICPHSLYLLVLLLITLTSNMRMRAHEEKINADMATIDGLTSTLAAAERLQSQNINDCTTMINNLTVMLDTPPSREERARGAAAVANLTKTLELTKEQNAKQLQDCSTKILSLADTLEKSDGRIQNLSAQLHQEVHNDTTSVDRLLDETLALRRETRPIYQCTAKINGKMVWFCSKRYLYKD